MGDEEGARARIAADIHDDTSQIGPPRIVGKRGDGGCGVVFETPPAR
jgi:hypothetical protein